MFAVFGVNKEAIKLKENKKGGSPEEISQRVSKALRGKTRTKVSPVYSDPSTCKTAIRMFAQDSNFSRLEIRFHLHQEVSGKDGNKRLKKTWVKYRGETDEKDLIANNRNK